MRKSKMPPSFEERTAAADAKAGAALSIFEQAANDLQQAAVEKAALRADIATELERLVELHDEAEIAEDRLIDQATNIRALLGLN